MIRLSLTWLLLGMALLPAARGAAEANPRFGEVARRLDEGGNTYLYLNAKGLLRGWVDRWTPALAKHSQQTIGLTDQALELLGLHDVEDVGLSGIEDGGIYRSKTYLRLAGPRRGLLGALGGEPHAFEALAYAPASTAYFLSTDVESRELLDLLRGMAGVLGAQAQAYYATRVAKVSASLRKSGLANQTLRGLLDSLDGEVAVMADLPSGGQPAKAESAPRILLMARVRKPMFYDFLHATLKRKGRVREEKETGGVREIALVSRGAPHFPPSPCVAFDGQYVIVASHAEYLESALETKRGAAGLTTTTAFERLTEGMPKTGNGFSFATKEGLAAMRELAKEWPQFAAPAAPLRALNPFFRRLARDGPIETGMASIRVNESQGIRLMSNGPRGRGLRAAVPSGLAGLARSRAAQQEPPSGE